MLNLVKIQLASNPIKVIEFLNIEAQFISKICHHEDWIQRSTRNDMAQSIFP